MFSEKYLAGFIDADGHFSVRARLGARPDLEFSLAQEESFREPLDYMAQEFGGVIRTKQYKDKNYLELCMRGGPARKVFERLKKHLVLKQLQAERFLELTDNGKILKTKEDVLEVRRRVKEIRAYGAIHQPNYPSRKWMAGYIDGDGSFTIGLNGGYAYPKLSILAAPNYLVGITLLQKAFGGTISGIGQNAVWQIQLTDPAKAIKVLEHCAPYLIKKKAQAYFILGCARNGNFRDGKPIRSAMMNLNSQQHRLSESTSVADQLVRAVDFTVPKRQQGRPRRSDSRTYNYRTQAN